MTTLYLKTLIDAPIEIVFDASRNIDLHMSSTTDTNEKAIAGVTSGLIAFNETVTWKARHFGVFLTHTSQITYFKFPTYFVDEMILGVFKSFKHQHRFKTIGKKTEMIDIITYELPFGFLGKLFNQLLLKKYLFKFIATRNLYLQKKYKYTTYK